ncbi:unnamed protein product (macronuclear) [Paramecium tetraurelia]|uniref:Uncharacterized protein n=1 Tax=Paramecium tetraurelia TaxID=5888 RepID=A0DMW5_PARTE|nr:uncharacterized protein GSPATT00018587001 [Paramecium tetraurelia]CAK84382.1 unnamed protein product [Paramecium tetraurelia]|eukprot:XP_001451779.1 hypothetical protein (macronuclear) [Paramecium tetraurelia strain d4-2]
MNNYTTLVIQSQFKYYHQNVTHIFIQPQSQNKQYFLHISSNFHSSLLKTFNFPFKREYKLALEDYKKRPNYILHLRQKLITILISLILSLTLHINYNTLHIIRMTLGNNIQGCCCLIILFLFLKQKFEFVFTEISTSTPVSHHYQKFLRRKSKKKRYKIFIKLVVFLNFQTKLPQIFKQLIILKYDKQINMIMWLIGFRLIIQIVGWRDQNAWNQIFGSFSRKCPELHTYLPDMHPHECVSYAWICRGITEIEVKIEVNGTQHLCHPRFQPYQKATGWSLSIEGKIFSCGKDISYATLVMELLSDGHYKYYCQSKQIYQLGFDYEDRFCWVTYLLKGSFKCQLCKFPFYGNGIGCRNVITQYDYSVLPPRWCPYNCISCYSSSECASCKQGMYTVKSNACSVGKLSFKQRLQTLQIL